MLKLNFDDYDKDNFCKLGILTNLWNMFWRQKWLSNLLNIICQIWAPNTVISLEIDWPFQIIPFNFSGRSHMKV